MSLSSKTKRQDHNKYEETEAQRPTKFLITIKKQVPVVNVSTGHVYACKLCNKVFLTFQALGGHQTAHNNRKKIVSNMALGDQSRKTHTCLICSQKFLSGQALGGHMRKHFIATEEKEKSKFLKEKVVTEHDSLASKSESIFWENFVKGGKTYDNPTLVTRNFFPMEPMWAEDVPVEVVSVLPLPVEEDNSWLELKLGALVETTNKNRQ